MPAWLLALLVGFLALAAVLPLRYIDRPAERASPERAAARPANGAGQLVGTKVEPLLPVPAGGLEAFVGRPAFGQKAMVQEINGNEGFWVGSSEEDRVYVEWGGDAERGEPSRFQPRQGERVSLIGLVQRPPTDPAGTLRLNAPEAREVHGSGGYVDADRVTPAGK